MGSKNSTEIFKNLPNVLKNIIYNYIYDEIIYYCHCKPDNPNDIKQILEYYILDAQSYKNLFKTVVNDNVLYFVRVPRDINLTNLFLDISRQLNINIWPFFFYKIEHSIDTIYRFLSVHLPIEWSKISLEQSVLDTLVSNEIKKTTLFKLEKILQIANVSRADQINLLREKYNKLVELENIKDNTTNRIRSKSISPKRYGSRLKRSRSLRSRRSRSLRSRRSRSLRSGSSFRYVRKPGLF